MSARAFAAVALVALGAAWVVASHLLMTRAPGFAWNGVIIVGPMLACLAGTGLRRPHTLTSSMLAVAAAAGLALLVGGTVVGGGLSLPELYVAQHATVNAALGLLFAQSLGAGRQPLITALARRVHHGFLTPDMERYSRRVTVVWAAAFGVVAVLSVALFVLAPFDAWATFANLLTPLALVLLFVGEYVARYRLHPEFERATLGDAVRAWQGRGSKERAKTT